MCVLGIDLSSFMANTFMTGLSLHTFEVLLGDHQGKRAYRHCQAARRCELWFPSDKASPRSTWHPETQGVHQRLTGLCLGIFTNSMHSFPYLPWVPRPLLHFLQFHQVEFYSFAIKQFLGHSAWAPSSFLLWNTDGKLSKSIFANCDL